MQLAVKPKAFTIPGQFGRPALFWWGVAVLTAGELVNIFDFLQRRATPGALQTMAALTLLGMAISIAGFVMAVVGLLPLGLRQRWIDSRSPKAEEALSEVAATVAVSIDDDASLIAMDSTRLNGTHWRMIGRLFVGAALDTMKPATLGFILPGLRTEYHLTTAQGSIFPLFALTGLTIGSVVFGKLGDVIGRRGSFILTALVLALTSFCSFMPGLQYQLAFCFTMGLAAGGELPIIYTLLAETMPARHRGWLSVAIGGVGGLAGYFIASSAAYLLEPIFTWRILWFPNLPTALFMLLLIKWVPESPRYLIQNGFVDEARRVMATIGVNLAKVGKNAFAPVANEKSGIGDLFRGGMAATTAMLSLYGIAWGLCNWGFITYLPTMLRGIGLEPTMASGVLATSALLAAPGTLVAAALFGFWSSKWSATIFAFGTGAMLLLLGFGQSLIVARPELLSLGLIGLLICNSSMIGVLAPYSVELFPTALRGVGSGVVTGSSKAGGLIGPPLVGAVLTLSPGLLGPGLLISIPMGLAGLLMAWRGRETRGRRLEDLAPAVAVPVGH